MILRNKTAIVTGASTGIGRSIAIAFASEGARVFLVARSIDRLEETKQLITDSRGNCEILPADLADLTSIRELIASIKKKTTQVDILANIAAVWHGKDEVYADTDFDTFDPKIILDTYYVGLTAPTLLIHGLIPLMPPQSSIINLSGTFSGEAKGWLPYFVSKRALEDLTIGLAQELEDKQIRVNCLSPADTATVAYEKFFPQHMDEAIEPEKIADFAVNLCSVASKSINGKVYVLRKGETPAEGFHN